MLEMHNKYPDIICPRSLYPTLNYTYYIKIDFMDIQYDHLIGLNNVVRLAVLQQSLRLSFLL